MIKVLDIFSGIGGFSLGLERTGGFKTVAFCEIEPFCRHVLAKHRPGVPQYDDVRTLTTLQLFHDGTWPDVICGGFPCQNISQAGRGEGLSGDRSKLWYEMLRLISEVRPRYAIVENVSALRSRGLEDVLGGLASIGYDAEWHCIPASALGAPHRRDRVWIVAYPASKRPGEAGQFRPYEPAQWIAGSSAIDGPIPVADANGRGWGKQGDVGEAALGAGSGQFGDSGSDLANSDRARLQTSEQARWCEPVISAADVRRAAAKRSWRRPEPGLSGETDGVSSRAHRYPGVEEWEGNTPRTVESGTPNRRPRLIGLGNSIVPQIAELIGPALLDDAQETDR